MALTDDYNQLTIHVDELPFFENSNNHFMKAKLLLSNGISNGVYNMDAVTQCEEGEDIPFGIAYLQPKHLELVTSCIKKVCTFDKKLRKGFKNLFSSNPIAAATLVRQSLNLRVNESLYIECLIKTLMKNSAPCTYTTSLYRVDGLQGDDRIMINELNANPIGGMWLAELARNKHSTWQSSLEIERVPELLIQKIDDYTQNGGAYFHPVRTLRGSSSYSEKLILFDCLKKLNKKFFMGTLDCLIFKKDGVFVKWEDKNYKIDYIGGLSSPEIFEGSSVLLDFVAEQKINCPSIINNIIGLCNKGMFTLITNMAEGKINPALLGFSQEDLHHNNPIPKTYWLVDKQIDRTSLFKTRNMVAKPIDGVGGKGIIFSDDHHTLEQLQAHLKSKYLIQDYYPSFQIKSNRSSMMKGSLDPYFSFDHDEGKLAGILVRSAKPGLLPSLTANSQFKGKKDRDKGYLFSLGVLQ